MNCRTCLCFLLPSEGPNCGGCEVSPAPVLITTNGAQKHQFPRLRPRKPVRPRCQWCCQPYWPCSRFGPEYRSKYCSPSCLNKAGHARRWEADKASARASYLAHREERIKTAGLWGKANPERRRAITARYREKQRAVLAAARG